MIQSANEMTNEEEGHLNGVDKPSSSALKPVEPYA
jgi:hypothetical protein